MLYNLLVPLSTDFGALNVFRYITFRASVAMAFALILTIVGALNWGSIGLFGFDLVAFLGGGQTAIVSRIIYTLVGLAGVWCISLLFRDNSGKDE